LSTSPVWEVVTPAQLGVVTFRYVADGSARALDRLQQDITARVVTEGRAVVATTGFGGRTVLRLCTINPRTTVEDVGEVLRRLEHHGREASEEQLRSDLP
jgi:aromatic-L-amino-acid decarboxylase